MYSTKEKINISIKNEIKKLERRLQLLTAKSRKISYTRLGVFLFGVISFLIFFLNNSKDTAVILASLFGAGFIFLVIIHNKLEKSIKRFRTYIQIKNEELARSNLDWDKIPFLANHNSNSSYIEQDFNVTEKRGLIHLIFTGITIGSLEIVRDWLSGKADDFQIIRDRQNIIRELKYLNHFRTRLLLTTRLSISNNLHKIEISEWIKNVNKKKGLKFYTLFLVILSLTNIFLLLGSFVGFLENYYYQFLLIYILFYFAGFKFIRDIQSVSEFLYDEVRKFASVFKFIENYNYGNNGYLKKSLNSFLAEGNSPSKILSKINFTVEILNLRGNPFVWFFLICLLPLDYLLSVKVENFHESIKNHFPDWINEWYHLEAYCSIAEFAYLNPDYTFPNFEEDAELFEVKDLGHPLIDPTKKVSNNFNINTSAITNIITGSNMSGKSTFLRTVGTNILLAYSGSVVNAEQFKISGFNLYSCIKVSDSVVDGISYFYAEVKRLKNILDEIKKSNAASLVLIDEIYKGTNNIERLIGSRALIQHLAENKIFNIISTHDLELVKIVDELETAKNYHFKEIIEDNKMSFDFKLMQGPSPSTNALKIMALEGLPT